MKHLFVCVRINEYDATFSDEFAINELTSDVERNLQQSLRWYEHAVELARVAPPDGDRVNSLLKRCANVENELGVFYMNRAASKLGEQGRRRTAVNEVTDAGN